MKNLLVTSSLVLALVSSAALAQGAFHGRHAGLGVQPETVSASSHLLRNAAPQTRRGNAFPNGIAVSPAFYSTGETMQPLYIHHADPAHGWVEVSMAELRRLGIADKVSGFSTRLDEVAYLEEDDDYDLFCKAKAARGETVAVKKVYREYNPVSNYPGYYRD